MRRKYAALCAVVYVVLSVSQYVTACDKQPIHLSADEMSRRVEKRTPIVLQGHNLRIVGSIELLVVVDPDGRPSCISVVRGHPILTSAAIAAVKDWHFQPYRRGQKVSKYSGSLLVSAGEFETPGGRSPGLK